MDQGALTELNIGQDLDDLANLDPRGYGVCRILYGGARAREGSPLSMKAAKRILQAVKKDDVVYIITGFVLVPHRHAETDGMVSSMLFARTLVRALGAKPVLIVPEDCMPAVRSMAGVVGLHLFASVEEMRGLSYSMAAISFTKDPMAAERQADEIIAGTKPAMVVSIEAPGANDCGVYHNAAGVDVSTHEAKSDVLFEKLCELGVPSLSIGDLGNEIGMGAIKQHLDRYIPGAATGACACGCGGGIAVATAAETIVTATVSDWGCYGVAAAMAYLVGDLGIMQDGELEAEVIKAGTRAGLIDMTGAPVPAVDGCDLKMQVLIVELMREIVAHALRLKGSNERWFRLVDELGYYGEREKVHA
jgi:hypothetical protein